MPADNFAHAGCSLMRMIRTNHLCTFLVILFSRPLYPYILISKRLGHSPSHSQMVHSHPTPTLFPPHSHPYLHPLSAPRVSHSHPHPNLHLLLLLCPPLLIPLSRFTYTLMLFLESPTTPIALPHILTTLLHPSPPNPSPLIASQLLPFFFTLFILISS